MELIPIHTQITADILEHKLCATKCQACIELPPPSNLDYTGSEVPRDITMCNTHSTRICFH